MAAEGLLLWWPVWNHYRKECLGICLPPTLGTLWHLKQPSWCWWLLSVGERVLLHLPWPSKQPEQQSRTALRRKSMPKGHVLGCQLDVPMWMSQVAWGCHEASPMRPSNQFVNPHSPGCLQASVHCFHSFSRFCWNCKVGLNGICILVTIQQ